MTPRLKRALIFGFGLLLGFGVYDWFMYEEFKPVKLSVGALAGGAVYYLILKLQKR